jgi:hypothetical protein
MSGGSKASDKVKGEVSKYSVPLYIAFPTGQSPALSLLIVISSKSLVVVMCLSKVNKLMKEKLFF